MLVFYNNHPTCTPKPHLNTLFAHFPRSAMRRFSLCGPASICSNRSVRKRWPG